MPVQYTVSHDEFLKDSLGDFPGAVRSVLLRELTMAMREFCEKSFVWTTRITGITVPIGDNVVRIDDGDARSEVVGIMGLLYGDDDGGYQYLTPLNGTPTQITTGSGPWGWYVTDPPDEVKIHPLQDEDRGKLLIAEVALIPAFEYSDAGADNLPRNFLTQYYDAIMMGFKARMFAQPNKPYSNPVGAAQLRHNFLRQIGYYSAQRRKGYNNSPSWAYPQTGWSPMARNRRTGGSTGV
jgi:hypothetical protein